MEGIRRVMVVVVAETDTEGAELQMREEITKATRTALESLAVINKITAMHVAFIHD